MNVIDEFRLNGWVQAKLELEVGVYRDDNCFVMDDCPATIAFAEQRDDGIHLIDMRDAEDDVIEDLGLIPTNLIR